MNERRRLRWNPEVWRQITGRRRSPQSWPPQRHDWQSLLHATRGCSVECLCEKALVRNTCSVGRWLAGGATGWRRRAFRQQFVSPHNTGLWRRRRHSSVVFRRLQQLVTGEPIRAPRSARHNHTTRDINCRISCRFLVIPHSEFRANWRKIHICNRIIKMMSYCVDYLCLNEEYWAKLKSSWSSSVNIFCIAIWFKVVFAYG